jgi:hypothetical protein
MSEFKDEPPFPGVKAEDPPSASVAALFSPNSPPPPGHAESSRSHSASPARINIDSAVKVEGYEAGLGQAGDADEYDDEKPDFLPEDLLPTPRRKKKGTSRTPPPKPALVDHLPVAWDEAHESFGTLEKCVYEHKTLGLSREQDEMMVCDCVYDRGESAVCARRHCSSKETSVWYLEREDALDAKDATDEGEKVVADVHR